MATFESSTNVIEKNMCETLQITWNEVTWGSGSAVVSTQQYYNNKPNWKFILTSSPWEFWLFHDGSQWVLLNLSTGAFCYVLAGNDCPISNISQWVQLQSADIRLTGLDIIETQTNCGCGIQYSFEINGMFFQNVQLNPLSTLNGKTFYQLWLYYWNAYLGWDGSQWVLSLDPTLQTNQIGFLQLNDGCPNGSFNIPEPSAWNNLTQFTTNVKACPIPSECDCGLTMNVVVLIEGNLVGQTWDWNVVDQMNGQPVFQYTMFNGQLISLWFDGGSKWNITEGDILIGQYGNTYAQQVQNYGIGCPVDPYEWSGFEKPLYSISSTNGVTCTICGREDRFAREFKSIKLPEQFNEQNRGLIDCCCEYMVLAGNGSETWKNDVTSAWMKLSDPNDSVTFKLEHDGVATNYTPQPVAFLNEPNAWFTTINWIDVLNSDGQGCFTLSLEYNIAGITGTLVWGMYKLQEYTIQNALKTARIRVKFNAQQEIDGINFTGSNVESSFRFYGFIGNRQPNTEIDNIIYSDRQMKRVIRENLNQYEITTDPSSECIIKPLIDLVLLSENEMWISDYNAHNHSYRFLDMPVIVEESAKIEYKEFSRLAVLTCVVSDKFKNQRTYFNGN